MALRVELEGTCSAHGALAAQEAQLRQEVLAQAVSLDADRLWIERVKLSTRSPAQAPVMDAETDDALASLAAQAAADPEFMAALQADLQTLLDSVKHEVLEASPELAAIRAGDFSPLMKDAVPALLARVEQAAS